MKLTLIESPYAAKTPERILQHERYARAAMADSLSRNEAPLASHLLYTQAGILDDTVPAQRTLGIEAGLAWGQKAVLSAVYTDWGITPGMWLGIQRAHDQRRMVSFRNLALSHPEVPANTEHSAWSVGRRARTDGRVFPVVERFTGLDSKLEALKLVIELNSAAPHLHHYILPHFQD